MALALRTTRLCSAQLLRKQTFQHKNYAAAIVRFYGSPSDVDKIKPVSNKLPPPGSVAPTDISESTVKLEKQPVKPKPGLKNVPNLHMGGSSSQHDQQKTKREQMRQNVQGYVFSRYFDYVKNYDKVLEKNFPSAMKVYRVFFDGVKDFFADMKSFLKIARICNDSPQGLKALNRKELELYMQMPRDMFKVAPALIGCSLPMVGYAFFPLVFMYPRVLLTSHFWTLQQRAEFQQHYMKTRLSYNRPVLRCLQAKLKTLSKHPQHKQFEEILGLLGSGFHPTVEQILEVKDIFVDTPYSLIELPRKHVKNLIQMHGLTGGLFKRHRLYEHAFLLHFMDLAITREGGVHNMQPEVIRNSCYLRGLNPTNLTNEEMVQWLRSWIKVSATIQKEHISLFLHLPIFLGYNHPNNWQLIYGDKEKWKTGSGIDSSK